MTKNHMVGAAVWLPLIASATPALADDTAIAELEQRVEKLEAMNAELMDLLRAQNARHQAHMQGAGDRPQSADHRPEEVQHAARAGPGHHGARAGGLVGTNAEYAFKMLDHAEDVNTKPLVLLQARQDGALDDRVTLSGGATVIANYQSSNRDSKFGWLMRHPTSNNQVGKTASEVVVHSAQLAVTAQLAPSLSAYAEMLYNPEQSFGTGTITGLNRNQVQMRKAFVVWGDLSKRPIYVAAGKMDVPFGMNDTVSPFTNSTNWHAFAPLAYAGTLGYFDNGLHLRATAIQGGAQFRAANTPVNGTATPSRVNNFALDGNYSHDFGDGLRAMAGASYIHGSTYCQPYPVFHFNPCVDNVPAWAAYGRVDFGRLRLIGEYAETTKVLPGSAVPDPTNPLSQFAASKVSALTLGGRYSVPMQPGALDLSVEFSNFVAGDEVSPWERQNQWVAGLSHFVRPNVNVFTEFVRTEGYVPLNFLSGGNFPDGSTWSDRDGRTHIVNLGVQAAF